MSEVNCQTLIPEVQGLEADKLTVGRHLILNCKGELGAFKAERAAFKIDETNPYKVKLFKATSSGSDLSLDLTFYTAGAHQLKDLVLSDGVNEITLNAAPVNVQSVIKSGAEGKPPEAFGPILPLSIAVPALYYFIVLLVVVVVTGLVVLRARRLSYYRKLKLKLKQYNSPVDPDTQFYKSIRQAEKLDYPLEKVESAFRLYVLRSYNLPLFDLSDERVARYFKRNYPAHKSTRASLKKLLSEFEELRKKPSTALSTEDKREFVKKLYRFVDTNRGLEL
jgi:hypothetical protein